MSRNYRRPIALTVLLLASMLTVGLTTASVVDATAPDTGLSAQDGQAQNSTPTPSTILWTAPNGTTFESGDALVAASGETVTPDTEPAIGDTQIYRIETDSFRSALETHSEKSGQDLLEALEDDGALNIDLEQTNPALNQLPKTLGLENQSSGISTVHHERDEASDVLFVVVNTSALQFQDGTVSSSAQAQAGDRFEVSIRTDGEDDPTTRTFQFVERETSLYPHEARTVTISNETTIYGTSTLAPGTEFDITIRGPNLLDHEYAEVAPNGIVEATFDLTSLSDGDSLEATLSRPSFSFEEEYQVSSDTVLTLPTADQPARNIDDDAHLEDVTGDGTTNIFDALAYYNNRDSLVVQHHSDAFDYDGDGETGTVFDALALYNEIA